MGNASWNSTIEKMKSDCIVAIASSTGGPAALMHILPKLPKDFPYPVVVVQHIWPGFTTGLTDSLKEKCPLPVESAAEGERLLPGYIYVAPSEHHIKVKKMPAHHHIFEYADSEQKKGSARPCADILFESLGTSYYEKVICVVLTGMGNDATKGIQSLLEKKDYSVIVQDEESSVVYGMPGSVLENIPGCEVVELDRIAEHVMELI